MEKLTTKQAIEQVMKSKRRLGAPRAGRLGQVCHLRWWLGS
jgi:hypothetical protein